ncbi:MAG: pyridoxamine kinase [Oscillospiraceae bacterium]|nr:pyridoxamine kinase [Oscillospiraceae bacterium]
MAYKKILTVQDISCVGQCSLTVALPILSACGHETCVLPSAVLSTHTGGFSGFTFRDLTEDMPAICDHWQREKISFSGIYTGYLGSIRQIDHVRDIMKKVAAPDCIKVVDPAMADFGKLYTGFDEAFVEAMKSLCAEADYVLPNVTESCFLTGVDYRTEYDRAYVDLLLEKLTQIGCKNIILTGISYAPGRTGVVLLEKGVYRYHEHEMLPITCHGTGDIYASAFVGALLRGKDAYTAARIAANYTMECVRYTATVEDHWYGAAFEPVLGKLIGML